ncbi:MAG: ribonuclease HIII [Acholeplasmataceae bacterium]|jgi:ribonuclease HIII|nr:ribonuclease HIII [Acholeplasmataceae bacterium]
MKYFSINLNQENLYKLLIAYQDFIVENNIEHALFKAVHDNVEIIAYKSGTVLLKGPDVSDEIILIKNGLGIKDYEAIGSDEVGTGDVFGPIIVCSALVKLDDFKFLEDLNVRDSKKMSDREIIKLGPLLAERLTHSLIILSPSKYNNISKRPGYNLNKIKAILHNQAILKTSVKYDQPVPVILDKFCTENNYYNYLRDEEVVYHDINFHEQAENFHLSVAAAAIIARFAFIVTLARYRKELGITIPKGAGPKVDEVLEEILYKNGVDSLKNYAKLNYRNVLRLLGDD